MVLPILGAYRHEQNKYDLHLLIFLMYPVYYLHEEKTEQVRKIKNDEAKNEHTKRFACRAISLSDWPVELHTSFKSNVYWFLLKTYAIYVIYIPTKQD